jgi:hypothetical protein
MAIKVKYIGGTSKRTWHTPDPNDERKTIENRAEDDCTHREMKWGPIVFPLDKEIIIDFTKVSAGQRKIVEHIEKKLAGGGNRFFKVEVIKDEQPIQAGASPVGPVGGDPQPAPKRRGRPPKNAASPRPAEPSKLATGN